jgi:mRNA-degrading endonuclease RelE of RelBE toxin-antitoxin system
LYEAQFTSDAVEDIRRLPKSVRGALRREFERKILKEPRGCSEELVGSLAGFRSFCFKNYRVVYRVFDDLEAVAVVGAGKKDVHHYSDLYKRLERLAATGELADTVLKAMRLFNGP